MISSTPLAAQPSRSASLSSHCRTISNAASQRYTSWTTVA